MEPPTIVDKEETADVVIITAVQLPVPDPETHLLLEALTKLGVHAIVRPWNATISWREVSLVVVRTAWDYFNKPEEFLDWANSVEKETQLIDPYQVLKWNMHKAYLEDLDRHGVPVIPTRVIRASEIHREITPHVNLTRLGFNGDTIVKPAISVGGFGLHRGEANSLDLCGHAHELLASGQDVLVQAFVSSVVHKGEVSLVFVDGRFSHSIKKIPKEGDFRVHLHHGGTVVPYVASRKEIAVARMALDVAPTRPAYARVDLIEGEDGSPQVMEVEMIEPMLYFKYSEDGLENFAAHINSLLHSP